MSNLGPAPALRSLDEQRREFARRRGIAMPLAGMVAWAIVGVAGALLPPLPAVWVLFGATGSIVLLGIFFSRFTGENFLDKQRPKNVFDGLFLHTVAMAILVYAIAIPFFQADYTSLPLSVGILSGLMWLPFSWIIGHWVGAFHTLARTALITAVWYSFPLCRFVVVPAVIVAVYAVTIVVLEMRWRRSQRVEAADEDLRC
ncbi:MAG: hypothetical protein U0793_05270 [Gemmataceae bacterium]